MRFKPGLALYGDNDPSAIAQANAWLGKTADYQLVFFNQSSWSSFHNSIYWLTDLHRSRYNLWSVPLAAEFGTLPDVVAGRHDVSFLVCAQAILAASLTGQPRNTPILIRTGWEFNLLSQEQRAFDALGNPDPVTWVAAYRHVIGLFRTVSNRFQFIWCLNSGDATENGLTVEACYPGDDVVHYVGLDLYFSAWDSPGPAAGADVFNWQAERGAGLNWLARFGAAHHKPIMLPETGVISDAATGFNSRLIAWIAANNVVLHGYWNSNAGIACKLSDGSKPATEQLFLKAYGR